MSQPLDFTDAGPAGGPVAPVSVSGAPPLATPAGMVRLFWPGTHDVFVPDRGVYAHHEAILVTEAEAQPLLLGGWRDTALPTAPPPEPPAVPLPPVHPVTVTLVMTATGLRRFRGRMYIPGEQVDVPERDVGDWLERGIFARLAAPVPAVLPEPGGLTLVYVGPEGLAIPGAGLFEAGEEVPASGAQARLLLRSGLFNDLAKPSEWLAFNVLPPEEEKE